MAALRIFTAQSAGVYLSAYSMAFAYTETEARKMINDTLVANGLSPLSDTDTLEEIPRVHGATLLWNGDY